MTSPSSPVLNSELVVALKRLKLGRIADTLPERLVLADKQEMTFDDLLLLVLTDEIARRDNTAAELRPTEARLDPAMHLETWDKTSKVSFDKRMLAELTSLRFLEAHRHVVVLGPVGVGKTFVSQALGHIACRHLATESARQLARRRDDRAHLGRYADRGRLRARADEQGGEQRRLPALPRTHRTGLDDHHEQSRHRRVARDVRRRAARAERHRPVQEAAYDFVMEGESYRLTFGRHGKVVRPFQLAESLAQTDSQLGQQRRDDLYRPVERQDGRPGAG